MYRTRERSRFPAIIPDLRCRSSEADSVLDSRLRAGEADAEISRPAGEEFLFVEDSTDAYRQFFTTMNEGAAILDFGRTIVNANQRLAKILFSPPAELSGTCFSDRIALPDRGTFESLFQIAWGGTPVRDLVRLLGEGGASTLVLLSLSPLPGGIRKQIGVVVMELFLPPRMQILPGETKKELDAPPESGGIKSADLKSSARIPRRIQILHPTHFRGAGWGRNARSKPGNSLNLSSDVDTRPIHFAIRNLFPASASENMESDEGSLDPESRRKALERVLLAPPRIVDRNASAAIYSVGETQTFPTLPGIEPQNGEDAKLPGDMHPPETREIRLPGKLPDRSGKPVAFLPEWKPKALLPGVPKDNQGFFESLLLPKRQLKKNQL